MIPDYEREIGRAFMERMKFDADKYVADSLREIIEKEDRVDICLHEETDTFELLAAAEMESKEKAGARALPGDEGARQADAGAEDLSGVVEAIRSLVATYPAIFGTPESGGRTGALVSEFGQQAPSGKRSETPEDHRSAYEDKLQSVESAYGSLAEYSAKMLAMLLLALWVVFVVAFAGLVFFWLMTISMREGSGTIAVVALLVSVVGGVAPYFKFKKVKSWCENRLRKKFGFWDHGSGQ